MWLLILERNYFSFILHIWNALSVQCDLLHFWKRFFQNVSDYFLIYCNTNRFPLGLGPQFFESIQTGVWYTQYSSIWKDSLKTLLFLWLLLLPLYYLPLALFPPFPFFCEQFLIPASPCFLSHLSTFSPLSLLLGKSIKYITVAMKCHY